MKTCLVLLVLVGLLACRSNSKREEGMNPRPEGDGKPASASRLEVAQPGAGDPFQDPRVEVMESFPVQFALGLTREMPTPGWTFETEVSRTEDRLVARIAEIPPSDLQIQILTPAPCRIHLGPLPVGGHRLDLLVRTGREGSFEPAQTLHLKAW